MNKTCTDSFEDSHVVLLTISLWTAMCFCLPTSGFPSEDVINQTAFWETWTDWVSLNLRYFHHELSMLQISIYPLELSIVRGDEPSSGLCKSIRLSECTSMLVEVVPQATAVHSLFDNFQ